MKIHKIIHKNFKLLMRSKLSSFVMIFGPLLVIFMVGASFGKGTSYNLNIGIYADEFTPLMESFIEQLSAQYKIIKYYEETDCIEDIKYAGTHACLVFPADFSIENDQQNLIKIFVDQSKINLVYLVINQVQDSFNIRTEELSMDMTSKILDVTFDNKDDTVSLQNKISGLVADNNELGSKTESSITELSSLDLDVEEVGDLGSQMGVLTTKVDDLKEDILSYVDDALDEIEDLRDLGLDSNESNIVDDIEDIIIDINSTTRSFHNSSSGEIIKIIDSFDDSISEMAEKLEAAEAANEKLSANLNKILDNTNKLKSGLDESSSLVTGMISRVNSIQVTNAENIVNPINTQIEEVVPESSTLGLMFPSLIVLLIMFTGLLMPALLIIIEKNSKAAFRVFLTPSSELLFTFSIYLTGIVLLAAQMFVILGVSEHYFSINISHMVLPVVFVLLLISSMFILAGMLIGNFFNTEEIATLVCVSLVSIMLLTSGLIFPLESMPRAVLEIVKINPLVVSSNLFKNTLLFTTEHSILGPNINLLLGYSLILFVAITLSQKFVKYKLYPKIKKFFVRS